MCFKVNGQSHIILQQLSCGTRSKVSFVSNPAQITLKHSSQLTNKTTLATSFVFIRHVFHCVLIRNKRDLTSSSTRQLLQNNMGLTIYLEGSYVTFFRRRITRVSKSWGNNFITYKKKKTNLFIFNVGKNFRSKIRSWACPHEVSPGMPVLFYLLIDWNVSEKFGLD
jgi:hypothetical protein